MATLPSISFSVFCNVMCCAVLWWSGLLQDAHCLSAGVWEHWKILQILVCLWREAFLLVSTLLHITKLLQCDTATDTEWVTHGVDLGFVDPTQVFHVKKCWGAYCWLQCYQIFFVKSYWECHRYSIDVIITIITVTTITQLSLDNILLNQSRQQIMITMIIILCTVDWPGQRSYLRQRIGTRKCW